MTYSSLDGPRSSRNRYTDPPSLVQLLSGSIVRKAQGFRGRLRNVVEGPSSPDRPARQGNFLKRILTVPTLLILLWAWTIWRGERSVFQTSVAECRWDNWEHWVDI
jgi:hypothetical protein